MPQQLKATKEAVFLSTECTPQVCHFQSLNKREVVAEFNGGKITSDGGALLLREVEKRTGMLKRFSECFRDQRDLRLIEHSKEELIRQRVYALALGYEDLNDHDELRADYLLATIVEKSDPTGQDRRCPEDRGKPLAGKSTLNRLELYPETGADKYKRISVDGKAVQDCLVDIFLDSYPEAPKQIIVDFDATDDPVHGNQEGRFFHGYYDSYCYLPLYVFCDGFCLHAELRPSNIDASEGTVEVLEWMVPRIRRRWPKVEIVVRGDSGFARDRIMDWCEEHEVDYVFGLARNARLIRRIESELEQARELYQKSRQASRVYSEFEYQTLDSWSRARRVVAKAEYLAKGSNPRFIVTSLPEQKFPMSYLYEEIYCARGDLENRIKEQQLALFADRTSSRVMKANQLRLWFSTFAYLLIHQLRRLGLQATPLARAQCDTIRLKLFKIGAVVKVSVRRIFASLATGYPYQQLFCQANENLQRAGPVLSSA